jgi:hypothetical protein
VPVQFPTRFGTCAVQIPVVIRINNIDQIVFITNKYYIYPINLLSNLILPSGYASINAVLILFAAIYYSALPPRINTYVYPPIRI